MVNWLDSLFPAGFAGEELQTIIAAGVVITACTLIIYAIDTCVSFVKILTKRK